VENLSAEREFTGEYFYFGIFHLSMAAQFVINQDD
jgi:hypothetical protein